MAEWMNSDEVAEFFGISPRTLDDWCLRRKLRFYKVGRRRRFRRSDCTEAIERMAVDPLG